MVKAVIVDDEPGAIRLLASYLEHFATVELVASFRNPIKAFEFLGRNDVGLVFLDINMPRLSGISLSRMLSTDTKVVFTTAYPEFAVESYEISALDYLLKPIGMERFSVAMTKVMAAFKSPAPGGGVLCVKSGANTHRIVCEDIRYLEKDGNYLTYYMENARVVARQTVEEALDQLPEGFVQVHKSYIVNTLHVQSFTKEHLLVHKVQVPVGRSFKQSVHSRLNSP